MVSWYVTYLEELMYRFSYTFAVDSRVREIHKDFGWLGLR